MGRSRFVNQKLGKNVSRKVGLLKSQLAVQTKHSSPSRSLSLPTTKKEISLAKS
jgi:hypothetical protein